MRISFERTGGFAGMKLQRTIDSRDLPPEDAQRLDALLKKSCFFHLPTNLQSLPAAPDRFHYKVTVERDADVRTVEASEGSMPDDMRPLIDWLTRFSRT